MPIKKVFSGVGTGSTTPENKQLDDPGHKPVPSGKMKDAPSRPSTPDDGVGTGKFKPQKHGIY